MCMYLLQWKASIAAIDLERWPYLLYTAWLAIYEGWPLRGVSSTVCMQLANKLIFDNYYFMAS
jgi:hypothetical protein